jgi:starch phosphorylase
VSEALCGALEDLGFSAVDIFEEEPDAGLGNGGLGRLAACYMDSMATLGMEATGYSICYELGIFRQKFQNGKQTEVADNWAIAAHSWLVAKMDDAVEVRFGGHISPHWDSDGRYYAEHTGYTAVTAVPRDMLIAGYGGKEINTLRLWEARSTNSLDMYLFSEGEYVKSLEERTMSEVITKVLYPADDHIEGKKLRIKQQYFFVSATAQDIVRKDARRHGAVEGFRERHAIQINDTHPALIIPELLRIFMDEYGLGWDEAWREVSGSVFYTNHTVLSEALEKWPQGLIQSLLPRVWEILCEIDRRRRAAGGQGIVRDGQVHMAELCLAACGKINGVSQLHGEILRRELFRAECEKTPERFLAVTNGVDHRRWLAQINPSLHRLLSGLLGGDDYLRQPEKLRELEKYLSDEWVLGSLRDVKRENKLRFAEWFARQGGCALDPDTVFDVQIKRLHEYKRQLLNVLNIIHQYFELKDHPEKAFVPRTWLFGAKAAPGYFLAKRIIKLINDVAGVINNDPAMKGRMNVLFLPDYRVSLAERIIPAADLSEQISTAGTEASGTGNMKFQLNGALTIGTLDGANVEIRQEVGEENFFLFGKTVEEVEATVKAGYDPWKIYDSNPALRRVLDALRDGFFNLDQPGLYQPILDSLLTNGDHYLVLADFDAYVACQEKVAQAFLDQKAWARMCLHNIAHSGKFSTDRTIAEYAREIWDIKPCPVTLD